MIESAVDFKRLILGLPHSAGDYESVVFATQLAELLDLNVVGLFVHDESLTGLAQLSCVREFRALGGGWQPLDAAQLSRGLIQAAAEAQRRFLELTKSLRVAAQFDLAKGTIADVIAAQSHASDIIAIIEPRNPAERVTHQFMQMVEVALRAPAAVLLVPSKIRRQSGPIVAIAADERDPSIRAAARIAAATKERMIVLVPAGIEKSAVTARAGSADVIVNRLPFPAGTMDPNALTAMLSRIDERLVVLSRELAEQRLLPQLAASQGVPVLVTEPIRPEVRDPKTE